MTADGATLRLLASYSLHSSNNLRLSIVQGSVVNFKSPRGAIVNAANPTCLGGGGVDGAITAAGGPALAADRRNLPIVKPPTTRCPQGQSRLTGPNVYGKLGVKYVVHAVGPHYLQHMYPGGVRAADILLGLAYQSALNCCCMDGIEQVAFPLLSAGVFRGDQPLSRVLGIGVMAIRDWKTPSPPDTDVSKKCALNEVFLYCFTPNECKTLLSVCDSLLLPKPKEEPLMNEPNASLKASKPDRKHQPVMVL